MFNFFANVSQAKDTTLHLRWAVGRGEEGRGGAFSFANKGWFPRAERLDRG